MLLSGQVLPANAESGPTDPRNHLEFRLHQDYLIVVEGSLGDLKHQNLLIDTGSDTTILDQRVVRKLQLEMEHASLGTIRRDVDAWRTVLPTCQVGPITCRNYNVLVEDLSFLGRGLDTRVDAIIGLDLMSSLSFTVDYRAKRIFFGAPAVMDHTIAFETAPPLVTVPVTLNGRPMRLLVDTGASSLMLFKTRWSEAKPRGAPFLRPQDETRQSTNIGGELTRQMIALKTTSLGGTELGKKTAFLVEDRGTTGSFDGLFNPVAIGLRQISFDFENQRFGWTK